MPKKSRMLVVEHEDGRRVAVSETLFDSPDGNPFNTGHEVIEVDTREGQRGRHVTADRPEDDRVSLKAEGFKPVRVIDKHGHERALEDD